MQHLAGRSLRRAALAIALLAGGAVQADDIVTNVNLGGDVPGVLSGGFGVTHLESGAFEDRIHLSPTSGSWFVDSSIITVGLQPATNLDFTAADINGYAMTLTAPGIFEYGSLIGQGPITGPLVLTVHGNVQGIGGVASASYGGTVNISPIPEPSTGAMLLAGMGLVAYISRRRRN
ncbi:FxDxF family PEP-CTERM protein [Pseudoduganella lurida]|nr:FxDxF family PEP-CTERM protein [Pseudoduganella lurida]